ncbi:MAG: CPBP family intramembrane metalloprotease [Muribaculaceae bacterium]|nr:CPBP family intramembrane metalloprotease [Muribaculaceae bacterium]
MMTTVRNNYPTGPARGMVSMGVLLIGLFTGLILTVCISGLFVSAEPTRTELLWQSIVQSIMAFIVPTLVVERCLGYSPMNFSGLSERPAITDILWVLVIYICGYTALGQIIAYNEALHFPESLKGFEQTLRSWEENAAATTSLILDTSTVGGLIAGILVVGVLTGLAEEVFFRGGIQSILARSGCNIHIAIWGAAVIFSALHMQFFGFIPRLLLGAFFGYLLYWSGSLWPGIFAHALNNSLYVTAVWLEKRGVMNQEVLETVVVSQGFPWLALCSALVSVIVISVAMRSMKSVHDKT